MAANDVLSLVVTNIMVTKLQVTNILFTYALVNVRISVLVS